MSQAMFDPNNPLEILSTNTIQKDLSGIDPLLRSLALRSAVNMSNVSGLNQLSIIRSSLADSSVYVRKTACAALRAFISHTKITSEIIEMVHRSLYDSEPSVLSTAVQTAWVIRNQDQPVLPRPIFSRLLTHLPQMDHYGQFFAIDLLYRYCASNFSPQSNHPDLVAFLDRIDKDILPYSSSPAIVEISITALVELKTNPNFHQIWSHIVHHVSRLPPEYSQRVLSLALPIMTNPEFTELCPFDQFFVRSNDTIQVANLKVKILTRFVQTASDIAHAKIILREFMDYIHRFHGVGVECVSGIALIGHHFSELSETVLRILLTLISDEYVDDEITGEAISRLRDVVGTTTPSDSIIDTIRHICDKSHEFKNDKTRISALWLMTVYHDFIALVVPNVLRAFGARIHEQSALVKLQLCVLALESLKYYTCRNEEKVSKRLIGPLKELVEYIFEVCGTDQTVGDAVVAMRKKGIKVGKLKRCCMNQELTKSEESITFELFTNEKWRIQRPGTDRVDVHEEENGTEEKSNVRNMSSEQSSMNRTSAKVLVPSSVKPITKLEDLDLFFSVQETVAEDDAENLKSGNSKARDTTVRATIDLTELS